MEEYFAYELATFYCGNCDVKYATKRGLCSHFNSHHRVPNIYERPNIKDAILYCATCKKKLHNKLTFSEHMEFVHRLNPEFKYDNIDHSSIPNKNDSSYYCKVCKKQLSSSLVYLRHLATTHDMEIAGIVKTRRRSDKNSNSDSVAEDESSTNYCDKCKLNCESKEAYQSHMHKEHVEENDEVSSQKRNAERLLQQLPLPKKFKKVIRFGTIFEPGLMPDETEIKNYCCACDRNFLTRDAFKQHLAKLHSEIFKRRRYTEDNKPDPNHEHLYCSICEKRAISRRAFHFHLRAIHYMEFDS